MVKPVLAEVGMQGSFSDVDASLDKLKGGIFNLVVMGEIKKGKSSFINALLKVEKLLPTDVDIATSTVFKILWGPKFKVEVFFLPDMDVNSFPIAPREIEMDEIVNYGTESGNPGNRKRVDYISIAIPNDILKTGLVVVDTPGVGGLYRKHRDIAWRFAPNADAVFFVLDSSEAPISKDEIEFLRELKEKITQEIHFVQTKTDAVSEEQWKSWERRNKQILAESLGFNFSQTTYIPISSTLKQNFDATGKMIYLRDSGFSDVEIFLRDKLVAEKDLRLCEGVANILCSKMQVAMTELKIRTENLRNANPADIAKAQLDNDRISEELSDFMSVRKPFLMETFINSFKEVKNRAMEKIDCKLSRGNDFLTDRIFHLKNKSDVSIFVIDSLFQESQQSFISYSAETIDAVVNDFNDCMHDMITATAKDISDDFAKKMPTLGMANFNPSALFSISIKESLALNQQTKGRIQVRKKPLDPSLLKKINIAVNKVVDDLTDVARKKYPAFEPFADLVKDVLGTVTSELCKPASNPPLEDVDNEDLRRSSILKIAEEKLMELADKTSKLALKEIDRCSTNAKIIGFEIIDGAVKAVMDSFTSRRRELAENQKRTQVERNEKLASVLKMQEVIQSYKALLDKVLVVAQNEFFGVK